jgi:serine acetyltransferase
VLGDVRIGNGAIIGANAVVTRDIPAGATVVGANRIVPTTQTQLAADANGVVTQFPLASSRR